ncbi:uncharacterized protein LOC129922464 isoform X1 [Biomphalaria glabrata]|uniref:Uncharacterized protein LOC129922464 isoform X1 n=1 Tax=Biomphalaria glabrata TaxID=6526 RepID=A0A9W2YPJ9_BIOGL|nr:uncharacterized protein LOC129922464 isoform X1 [Biomphalaria glabrata]XP_055864642.1 uncharacterized protein LOC129922464 isoform X1 [Biomphalaria glabrata]XP_055864643.1 uncharacterized protein LOC129922464 isoform X1 [Biomphalaria glabrata]XP_055864644.1 uncharacterized protein LOC129922464 isoform X1 [Biomphalaria glabrata]
MAMPLPGYGLIGSPFFYTSSPPPSLLNQHLLPKSDANTESAILVQILNKKESGEMSLKELFTHFTQSEEIKQLIWKLLIEGEKNFQIDGCASPASCPPYTGNETIKVLTKLTLCEYHCKQGKNGSNRKCSGKCGALHLCRNFLLKSSNECRFSKKQNCMFGHDFQAPHNSILLREHNLHRLNEVELRQLFRRPLSRCKITTPQVCWFYNNEKKKCTNKRCTSLHICMQYILGVNHYNCNKMHSFGDETIRKVLDLYEINSSWKEEQVCELLRNIHRLEHTSEHLDPTNESSDDESCQSQKSSYSINSDIISQLNLHSGSDSQQAGCGECKKLSQSLDTLKVEVATEISLLHQEIKELKTEVERLKTLMEAPAATSRTVRLCPITGLPVTE